MAGGAATAGSGRARSPGEPLRRGALGNLKARGSGEKHCSPPLLLPPHKKKNGGEGVGGNSTARPSTFSFSGGRRRPRQSERPSTVYPQKKEVAQGTDAYRKRLTRAHAGPAFRIKRNVCLHGHRETTGRDLITSEIARQGAPSAPPFLHFGS